MAQRVQSPSSINVYKQCPRKYYYIYIKKLKTLPSIHLIRGSIVHSALEDFFKLDPRNLPEENYEPLLQNLLYEFLRTKWNAERAQFEDLGMTEAQRLFYYEETERMLRYWLKRFLDRIKREDLSFKDAFAKWVPITEEEFISDKHKVKGFIDAIHKIGEEVIVMDYKTSKKDAITPEYRLQLAIYALLFHEKYGVLPQKAGINFLLHGERMIDVDEELVTLAKREIELIHMNTESDDINDYPMKPGPLCKWSSGQCDFFELCYGKNGDWRKHPKAQRF
ncbi:MAG: RecB family exonuclease [Candidatus Woesearchaeota archaeon]